MEHRIARIVTQLLQLRREGMGTLMVPAGTTMLASIDEAKAPEQNRSCEQIRTNSKYKIICNEVPCDQKAVFKHLSQLDWKEGSRCRRGVFGAGGGAAAGPPHAHAHHRGHAGAGDGSDDGQDGKHLDVDAQHLRRAQRVDHVSDRIQLSDALKDSTRQFLNAPIRLQEYRQIAIAIERDVVRAFPNDTAAKADNLSDLQATYHPSGHPSLWDPCRHDDGADGRSLERLCGREP